MSCLTQNMVYFITIWMAFFALDVLGECEPVPPTTGVKLEPISLQKCDGRDFGPVFAEIKSYREEAKKAYSNNNKELFFQKLRAIEELVASHRHCYTKPCELHNTSFEGDVLKRPVSSTMSVENNEIQLVEHNGKCVYQTSSAFRELESGAFIISNTQTGKEILNCWARPSIRCEWPKFHCKTFSYGSNFAEKKCTPFSLDNKTVNHKSFACTKLQNGVSFDRDIAFQFSEKYGPAFNVSETPVPNVKYGDDPGLLRKKNESATVGESGRDLVNSSTDWYNVAPKCNPRSSVTVKSKIIENGNLRVDFLEGVFVEMDANGDTVRSSVLAESMFQNRACDTKFNGERYAPIVKLSKGAEKLVRVIQKVDGLKSAITIDRDIRSKIEK